MPPEPSENETLRSPRICGCITHTTHDACTSYCDQGTTHCGYAHGRSRVDAYLDTGDRGASHQRAVDAKLELAEWWSELAQTEADQVVAKAIEYGSRDLVEIGLDLARCMDRQVTEQEAAELGVYFYLRGKLARWTEAVVDGRPASDDTLKDIGVYVRMAQRIRSHGGWPGVK